MICEMTWGFSDRGEDAMEHRERLLRKLLSKQRL